MKYLDTGGRDPRSALAAWLREAVREATELRWQTGFFYVDGASPLVEVLEQIRRGQGVVRAVLGANMETTLRADVEWLTRAIGIPRANARLGVVSFGAGLFHPKTYHITRADGSATAYVGSANMTAPAMSGLNIEAGIVLDTRDSDLPAELESVALGIDGWFAAARGGFHEVDGDATIARLVDDGILAIAPPPPERVPVEAAAEEHEDARQPRRAPRPRLQPLLVLPRIRMRERQPAGEPEPRPQRAVGRGDPAVPRRGFPGNFLFQPDAQAPTSGADALSGSTLPAGVAGLIVQLNKDSARHFEGRTGTANMSLPLATLSTIRFGVFDGKYLRPRAEFGLTARFVADDGVVEGEPLDTAIMAYGYAADEPGHRDVRMVLPAGIRELNARIIEAGHPSPKVGELAFLEWPTTADPTFRLSYLETGSRLAERAALIFNAAKGGGQLVGGRTCWLPDTTSPSWD